METAPLQLQSGGAAVTADFAALAGAALREMYLSSRWRTIGLNDSVDLSRQLKERVHVFPLVVVGLIAVFFLGHFLLLNFQMS